MGMYINQTQNGSLGYSKVRGLVDAGATILGKSTPDYQPNLICVVDNGMFEAAGYCYSEDEYKAFAEPCGRKKTWLTWDKVTEFAN